MKGLGLWLTISKLIARPFALAAIAVLRAMTLVTLAVFAYIWGVMTAIINQLFIRGEGRKIRGGPGPLVRRMTIYRTVARCIDIVLPLVFVGSIFALVPEPSYRWLIELHLIVAYLVVSLYATGTTVGKSFFGLRVVSTAVDRSSFPQLFIREVVALISLFVFPLAIYVVMKNQDGEQIGDVVADTVVLQSEPIGVAGLRAYSSSFTTIKSSNLRLPGTASGGRETTLQNSSAGGQQGTASGTGSARDRQETTLQQSRSGDVQHGRESDCSTGDTDVYPEAGKTTHSQGGTGRRTCPQCGARFGDQASYCPDCGTQCSVESEDSGGTA